MRQLTVSAFFCSPYQLYWYCCHLVMAHQRTSINFGKFAMPLLTMTADSSNFSNLASLAIHQYTSMAGTPPVSDTHQHILVFSSVGTFPDYFGHLNRHNLSRASVDPTDTHSASLATHMSMAGTPPVSDFRQHLLVYPSQSEHHRTFPSRLTRQIPLCPCQSQKTRT